MEQPWNLEPEQWAQVLSKDTSPKNLAQDILKGKNLPWVETLINETADAQSVLDLGSGCGQNSAVLALKNKKTTLFDWSQENIDFSKQLYSELKVQGTFLRGDITQKLPFDDNSVDAVVSCGVLEYFTDEQIKEILKEIFRVARKRVIILVPNAYSVCYRLGMWYMKKKGTWHWGGERAFKTLKHCFSVVPNIRVKEFSVGTKHSLNFLDTLPKGAFMHRFLAKSLQLKDHARPSSFNQGYILITIGEKI